LGVLVGGARAPRPFSDDVVNFVWSMACVLATAVEQRRAARELGLKREELQTLSRKLIEAQEAERRAVARELHDDFGQIVAAIGTLLGRTRRHAAGDAALASELEEVRTIAQQTLDRIRSRSQWLHPGVLDDFGLARALEGCVEQFQRQTGIRTHLTAAGPLDSVREDCAIHVYRIVQEALNNAARHSGSPEAWVRIDCRGGDLQLDIEDHGSGIVAASPAGGAERGMGMVSMRERAELIGGELHVVPAQRGGTVVRLRVPGCLETAAPEVA
jgi:signal transduction histidine kinase